MLSQSLYSRPTSKVLETDFHLRAPFLCLLAYSQANSKSPSPVKKKLRLSEAQSKTNGIPKRLKDFTRFYLVAFYKLKIIF